MQAEGKMQVKGHEREPKAWIYSFYRGLFTGLCKLFFKIRWWEEGDCSRSPGMPALILGNHQSYLDPVWAAATFPKDQIIYVAGQFLFKVPVVRRILHYINAIPKRQFVADPTSVRAILKALRAGKIVLLYPEGQRCYDGRTMPMALGIAKLIAKHPCDVFVLLQKGGYLAWPRWSRGQLFRRGSIFIEKRLLLRADETVGMSVQEIQAALTVALQHHELAWLREMRAKGQNLRYRSRKRARGLEYLLYRCPDCGALQMESQKNRLHCTACGAELTLSDDYRFTDATFQKLPEDLVAWRDWQKAQIIAAAQAGLDSPAWQGICEAFRTEAELAEIRDDQEVARHSGRVELKWPKVRFVPEAENAEALELDFAAEGTLFLTLGEYYDLDGPKGHYRLYAKTPAHTGLALDLSELHLAKKLAGPGF